MSKDPYLKAARAQHQSLQSSRAQALAEIEASKQSGDKYLMGEAIQRLADINAAQQNLEVLADQYVKSQAPVSQYVSPEERAARPIERMDWQDVVDMARQSKYAKNIQPNDPNLIAGYQEAQRRRSRGE